MKKQTILVAGISWTLVMVIAHEAPGTMLAVRYSGLRTSSDIIVVDEVNHSVSPFASSGTVFMNSLARDGQGWFWTAAPSTDPSRPLSEYHLIRINPMTGQTTTGPKLSPSASSSIDYHALSFSLDGTLYGMDGNDNLARIDMSTGDATYVGHVGVLGHPIGISGMAFTPDGSLYGYGVDIYGGFVRINPANATWQYLSTVPRDVQALTSSATGVLYGARDSLYQVNSANGGLTTIMSGLGDVRGIGFVVPLVPEPITYELCCAVLICCLLFTRFRRALTRNLAANDLALG